MYIHIYIYIYVVIREILPPLAGRVADAAASAAASAMTVLNQTAMTDCMRMLVFNDCCESAVVAALVLAITVCNNFG